MKVDKKLLLILVFIPLLLAVITAIWYAFIFDETNDDISQGDNVGYEQSTENMDDFDIFKDLIIEYSEKTGKITLDNSECSEFVKENVIFAIRYEKEAYTKGEVVEIIGYVDMNAASDNRYNIISTTYEYVVE